MQIEKCDYDFMQHEQKQYDYNLECDAFIEYLDKHVFNDELIKYHLKNYERELGYETFCEILIDRAISNR